MGSAPRTPPPETEPALVALFSYVALDRETRRPVAVPPFVPQTQEEKAWFEERQRVADARRRQRQREKERLRAGGGGGGGGATATATSASAAKQPDDADDQPSQAARADLMRRFSQAAARLADLPALSPPRLLPVSFTRVDNALITQPQHKNTSGAVFGGFLMRRAFELSFAAAFLFAGCRPAFVRCDDVSFAAPVDVGDLMRFSARVLAAWRRRGPGEDGGGGGGGGSSGGNGGEGGAGAYLVAIEAVAERARPDRRTVATTNTFRYVFRCTPAARGAAAAGTATAGPATGATAGAAAGAAAPPPVLLRVPIPTTAEDAQRVGILLSELSDADVAAVMASLDDAERE
jgi:acyl-CoA hydrolase